MSASSFLSHTGLLGYLTFVEFATHGMVGGYLLVNQYARPLEFHCTAPVCPTRTHQILYGPTLRSVLCCDQIGSALLAQTDSRPELLLTDDADALTLRTEVNIPMVLLSDEGLSPNGAPPAAPRSFAFGGRILMTSPDAPDDQDTIERTLRCLAGEWDLSEPLDRIRAAIQEAQRAAA